MSEVDLYRYSVMLGRNRRSIAAKSYAYYEESDYYVDWSRVCRDCWRFPNLCDHIGVRVLRLVVIQ